VKNLILVLIIVCSFESLAVDLPRIPIHFVVLSSSSDVHRFVTIEQLDREIEILNSRFVRENREKLFGFYRKYVSFYSDIAKSDCKLLRLGDQHNKPSPTDLALFHNCQDRRIRDPGAINFYIFKSYYEGNTLAKNSFAGGAAVPLLMINWERMVTRYKAAQEHEMGHIFGLEHIKACGSTSATNTNIMATSDDSCEGDGGNRNVGFYDDQVSVIMQTWNLLKQHFEY
jgi:hypothetical protein